MSNVLDTHLSWVYSGHIMNTPTNQIEYPIGSIIQHLRKTRTRLNQTEFGEKVLGMCQNGVSRIESSRQELNPSALKTLLDFFGLTFEEFLKIEPLGAVLPFPSLSRHTKPYEVLALCHKCHRAEHKRLRALAKLNETLPINAQL